MPLTHPELYEEMGIKPPKGVILYGVPGTGVYNAINKRRYNVLTVTCKQARRCWPKQWQIKPVLHSCVLLVRN